MTYIAQKVCNFNGQEFLIGDSIPTELVKPERVSELVKIGLIAMAEKTPNDSVIKAEEGQVKFCVNLQVKDGELPVDVTDDELQAFFDVTQANVENAKKLVSKIESESVLIMLDILDVRKSVKEAARERAKALFSE